MKKVKYVVCVLNKGYKAYLELRKLYEIIPDSEAEIHGLIRVVDESGEDYLYPRDFFLPIDVPEVITHAFAKGGWQPLPIRALEFSLTGGNEKTFKR